MDRTYWEKIAPDYNEEIFDVLHNDRKAIIRKAIRKVSGPGKTVLDAGCAVGKWLPVLAPAFKKVIAADISSGNLRIASRNHGQFENVEYLRVDFSSTKTRVPKSDVAVCINAILTDSVKKRDAFFANLASSVKKGGYLVLVVPSLESYLFTRIIQQKWKIDASLFREKISALQGLAKYRNAMQGHLDIDGVPTKHYLKEELAVLLDRNGFHAEQFSKIEYEWSTEFIKAPSWLKEPRPWDWMTVASRK